LYLLHLTINDKAATDHRTSKQQLCSSFWFLKIGIVLKKVYMYRNMLLEKLI